ncbi:hypothetical protein WICPIJ_004898 [Wickerhamomyces pijperi]|uniref:Uncharacterized protein n=1 Tax=Wickerhamomyces pijperi TaxID=599730 RepID=A0A9P8Q4Y3_WICPI|nr:hypothetical protein WICPIJ_004898 [Wickerhamomyces pijperi]
MVWLDKLEVNKLPPRDEGLSESMDLNISRSLVTELSLDSIELISSCKARIASLASKMAWFSKDSNLDLEVFSSVSNLVPNCLTT